MRCPVHSKTVTVIEVLSETGPPLKVSNICCEQFSRTITAVMKTNLQHEMFKQGKTKSEGYFTDSFGA